MSLNKSVFMGRLTKDVELRYSSGEKQTAVARYTVAVDRGAEEGADFINCVAFGSRAEFADKYLRRGTKVVVTGKIRTGSYTNREGVRIPTFEIIVEEQHFAESKNKEGRNDSSMEGFMNIPDGLDDETPFR